MTNKTDAELVALTRSGDKDAFGQLIERYQQMVRRIALDMVAHEEIARELAQEAILQAYLSLDHLRDSSRFKSWLYGIVLNVCRSYIRDQKVNPYSLEAMMGGMYRDTLYFPSVEVLERMSIMLPEGKKLQVDKDKARESVMKKIEEQQQAAFSFIKGYNSLTAQEREQEGRKFVEFLAEMIG